MSFALWLPSSHMLVQQDVGPVGASSLQMSQQWERRDYEGPIEAYPADAEPADLTERIMGWIRAEQIQTATSHL